MPEMGRPINHQERSFDNVQMAAPRRRPVDLDNAKQVSAKEKERLINKIQGYKKKNDLIVDGRTHNKMGKDEFLKLLTVQLQNQDPTSPMKQEKMAAELAQFSQLEQLTNLNEKFDGLSKNQHIESKFYAASFLGKEVVTSGSSMKFAGEGKESDILFTLPKPASKVLIRVFDKKNNMVGEMWRENIGRGNQSVSWDGMQLDKTYSAAGEFSTKVFAWDQFADPISVATKSTGTVESVFFENGETVLKVDGKKVFLRDVDSFHTAQARDKINPGNTPKRNVSIGRSMGSPLNDVAPSQRKGAPRNFPIAPEQHAEVNLNKSSLRNSVKAYKEHIPSTGITSVYDE